VRKIAKIHIVGASGSGTTTLGEALSEELEYQHFDTDDYYWKVKYSEKVEVNERIQNLSADLAKHENWVLSGSLVSWSDSILPYFDLVIFLSIPKQVRLRRLQQREFERYGKEIEPGGSKYEESKAFLQWAALYDEAGIEVRSKQLHEVWMEELPCPILKIEGDYTIKERVDKVVDFLTQNEI
jgi:adenylate kinase family enzyme